MQRKQRTPCRRIIYADATEITHWPATRNRGGRDILLGYSLLGRERRAIRGEALLRRLFLIKEGEMICSRDWEQRTEGGDGLKRRWTEEVEHKPIL